MKGLTKELCINYLIGFVLVTSIMSQGFGMKENLLNKGNAPTTKEIRLGAYNKIAVGFDDGTIKITNILNGNIQILKGHEGKVNCIIQLSANDKIASGSDDKSIKIWNRYTGDCIKTLRDIACVKEIKELLNGSIRSRLEGEMGRIWNLHNNKAWDLYTKEQMETLIEKNSVSIIEKSYRIN